MEAWLPIGPGVHPDAPVAAKETPGGLYALRKGRQPWNERIWAAEAAIAETFRPWLEENGYEEDHERMLLHEHIVAAGFVGRPFREDPGFRIDIYLPIKPRG